MSDAVDLKSKAGGKVTVSTTRGMVMVRWLGGCGTRYFNPDQLVFAITNLEDVSDRADGYTVWMEDDASEGGRYAVHLANGRLHADATPGDDVDHVSWAQFRKALLARAKTLQTPPENG
jgi:uncharacterized protein YodC (DUF2158 family)